MNCFVSEINALFFQIISFYLLCRLPCFHGLCGPCLLSWSMLESWVSECNCTVRLRSPDPMDWENQIDPRPERRLLLSYNCTSNINMSSCYSAVQWCGLEWNIKKFCLWMGVQILSPIKAQACLSTLVVTILVIQTVFSYINQVLLNTGDLPHLQMHPWNTCHLGCVTFTESSNSRDTLEKWLILCSIVLQLRCRRGVNTQSYQERNTRFW